MRMRRVKNYEAEYSKLDGPTVTFRDQTGVHAVELTAGGLWNVELEVFRESGYTYVLSWNTGHPYVGIEKFLGREPKGNLFLGKSEAIEEVLGKRGLNLTPMTIAKQMLQHLEERVRRGAELR